MVSDESISDFKRISFLFSLSFSFLFVSLTEQTKITNLQTKIQSKGTSENRRESRRIAENRGESQRIAENRRESQRIAGDRRGSRSKCHPDSWKPIRNRWIWLCTRCFNWCQRIGNVITWRGVLMPLDANADWNWFQNRCPISLYLCAEVYIIWWFGWNAETSGKERPDVGAAVASRFQLPWQPYF